MKVAKVVVHVEGDCVRCGGPAVCLGFAALLSDGRIGEPLPLAEPLVCNECVRKERDEEAAAQKKFLEQRKWANRFGPVAFLGEISVSWV